MTSRTLTEAFWTARDFSNVTATCPHCGAVSTFATVGTSIINGGAIESPGRPGVVCVRCGRCPGCKSLVIGFDASGRGVLIYPRDVPPDRAPADIDAAIKQFYDEARSILTLSPSGAALLARSCLQQVIRRKLNITERNLQVEIQRAIQCPEISQPTRKALDDVRTIGNWAAHDDVDLAKSILPVDLEEAMYTIEVLELFFDDLYLKPARISAMNARVQKRRDEKKEP